MSSPQFSSNPKPTQSLFVAYHSRGSVACRILPNQMAPKSTASFGRMEARLREAADDPSAAIINWIELPNG